MENTKEKRSITIIGAGPAGLSVGYYAKKYSFPFKIFESTENVGGNSKTIKIKEFYVDTGAHRLHDKDDEVTSLVKKLLGKDLLSVEKPTQILYKGKFVDFPLSPLNLLRTLGVSVFSKALFEIIFQKLKRSKGLSFKDAMTNKYGNIIASKFLLNYSQKLWGLSCDKLSPSVAGKRLSGLDFKTLLLELIFGKKKKTKHLDGAFYYPKYGIGMISEKLQETIGKENIKTSSKLTKVFHKNNHIFKIQVNNNQLIDVETLVNTIPITSFLKILNPLPPKKILNTLKSLNFRNIKLIIFLLNKESITKSATIHFPDLKIPFTRAYEPRNRSEFMSPKGKTSLVVEFPYDADTSIETNEEFADIAKRTLIDINLFEENDIFDTYFYDIENAYPVLEIGFEKKIEEVFEYLNSFDNLYSSGRSGLFKYSWIHNQIKSGKEIIDSLIN